MGERRKTEVLSHLLQDLSIPRSGKGKRETSFLASQQGLRKSQVLDCSDVATNPQGILSGFLPGQRISKIFKHSLLSSYVLWILNLFLRVDCALDTWHYHHSWEQGRPIIRDIRCKRKKECFLLLGVRCTELLPLWATIHFLLSPCCYSSWANTGSLYSFVQEKKVD